MIDRILILLHIRSPKMQTHIRQLLKFGMAGGFGSLVDLVALTFFVEYFHMSKIIAGIFSSFLAVIVVFTVNKFFTFRNHERTFARQIAKFALVYSMAFAMNIAVYSLLLQTGLHYIIAKFAAIGLIAMWNYYFSHTFIFKKS